MYPLAVPEISVAYACIFRPLRNNLLAASAAGSASEIIPTRSLNRNLNQFELSFIARGISIISVVCQIWSI